MISDSIDRGEVKVRKLALSCQIVSLKCLHTSWYYVRVSVLVMQFAYIDGPD